MNRSLMRSTVGLLILHGAVELGENGSGVFVALRVWALCPRRIATVVLLRFVGVIFADQPQFTYAFVHYCVLMRPTE